MKEWRKTWSLFLSFALGLVALIVGGGSAVVPVMTMWGAVGVSYNGSEAWQKKPK
ncbi:MAG: hypothetical protein ABIH23_15465 [bacterium]